jgi:hypothetical protein
MILKHRSTTFHLICSVWVLLFALVFSTQAQAAEFCVSSSSELSDALNTAKSNGEDDVIKLVKNRTYHGGFSFVSSEPNSLTIEGGYETGCTSRTTDPSTTILDGDSTKTVIAIESAHVKVDGVTVKNGKSDIKSVLAGGYMGGGIYFKTSGGNLEIAGSVFTGNSANSGMGGGVCVEAYNGTIALIFTNNTFTENSAYNGGGAYAFVEGSGCTVTFTNNTFNGNSAKNSVDYGIGGGVCALAYEGTPTLTFTNNSFTGNSANLGGGGVHAYVEGSGTIAFSNNIFTENSASDFGGGVSAFARYYGTIAFSNNTFTENSAYWCGGGVDATADGSGTIGFSNNTFTGNSASHGGGGVYANARPSGGTINLTFTNNTFTENSARRGGGVDADPDSGTLTLTFTNNIFYANQAESNGGAIRAWLYTSDSIARIYNNILWMNAAPGGADLWIDNNWDDDLLTSLVELFNNDFDQSSIGTYIKAPFTIDPSNLDKADPLFVDAPNGDLHLSGWSPCIDMGNNNAPELPPTDKDGNPRIFEGKVDIGAYEYQEILYVEPEVLCGGKLPCYTSIHEAISTSGSRAIINIAGGPYNENLISDQAKHLTLRGGWTSDFLDRDSFTTVNSITISGGTIVPDRIILK